MTSRPLRSPITVRPYVQIANGAGAQERTGSIDVFATQSLPPPTEPVALIQSLLSPRGFDAAMGRESG